MSLLSFLFGRNKRSANVAKRRLQIILAAERNPRSPGRPDYLPALQRELVGVVSKYVKIQPNDVRVSFERQQGGQVIRVKVELPQAARA
jgi:cell division topological specificity factor